MALVRCRNSRSFSLRKTYLLMVPLVSAFVIVVIFSSRWHLKFPSSAHGQLEDYTTSSKQTVLLFVGIPTAPKRIDRRNAIRETWKNICEKNAKVVCWFFTDGQDSNGKVLKGEVRSTLENESLVYRDIRFVQTPAGVNFGRRYLWIAEWATQRYNFQYLMYVDDDYFVCLDKLLMELEGHRPTHNFVWGWLHCIGKGAVVVDVGLIVITKDLIESFLQRKNSTLLCHPFAGQSIGMWLNNLTNVTTFGDNKRLLQHGIASTGEAAKRTEVCHTLLGIHKCFPEEMKIYWNIYQKENKSIAHQLPPITFPCHLPLEVNYKAFHGEWHGKPELCKNNPIWDRGEYFKGRQGN